MILNENSINNINSKEVLTKKYFDLLFNDSFNKELLIYAYKYENSIDDEIDDEVIFDSKDFKNWLIYEFENKFDDKFYEINSFIKDDNTINLYRIMMTDENWINHLIKEGKHLGIYWSFKKENAEPHWGYNQNKKYKVLLETNIDETYIDWVTTFRLNLTPNVEQEKEIRLFKNTPIKIISLQINDKPININFLNNKIFKA